MSCEVTLHLELGPLVEIERTEFRFMLKLPNKMKIYSSDEKLLNRILQDCGLFTIEKPNPSPQESTINVERKIDTIEAKPSENNVETLVKPGYSKEEIVNVIRDFQEKNGRPPSRNTSDFQTVVYQAEKQFGSWKEALRAAGTITYKQWRSQHGLHFKIKEILDNNPLTLNNLRQEIKKSTDFAQTNIAEISNIIHQSRDILSKGPHGHKIYFLKGQEPKQEAHPELNRFDRSQVEEELLKILTVPLTKTEVMEHFQAIGHNENNLIENTIKKAWLQDKIWRVKFVGHTSGSRYSASEVFGSLAGKQVYCRKDCAEAFALYIHENIEIRVDNRGFNAALTQRLKKVVPKEVIDLI
jgi:hypothetical protein